MTNPSLGTADWLAQIQEEILELERSLLFKETARRFYRLD